MSGESAVAAAMREGEMMNARWHYLCALLPHEIRRDPIVHNVAQAMIRQDDFSVELCLAEAVRQLVQQKEELISAKIGAAYSLGVSREQ